MPAPVIMSVQHGHALIEDLSRFSSAGRQYLLIAGYRWLWDPLSTVRKRKILSKGYAASGFQTIDPAALQVAHGQGACGGEWSAEPSNNLFGLTVTLKDVFTVVAAFVLSVGGAGAIIFALSSWLGSLWAKRLMAAETARHERDLARLKADLERVIDHSSQACRQKLELSREVAAPMIDLIVELEHSGSVRPEAMIEFERRRLNLTAHRATGNVCIGPSV